MICEILTVVSMEIFVFWDVTQYTSVSQKLADPIIRIHSSTLMMGVAGTSVMVYFYQTIWCHIPERAVFNALTVCIRISECLAIGMFLSPAGQFNKPSTSYIFIK
jgi:hypothetical protein